MKNRRPMYGGYFQLTDLENIVPVAMRRSNQRGQEGPCEERANGRPPQTTRRPTSPTSPTCLTNSIPIRAACLIGVLGIMAGITGCKKPTPTAGEAQQAQITNSTTQTAAGSETASGSGPNHQSAPNKPNAGLPLTAIDRNAEVVIIGYHRFVQKVKHPDTEITPADFEAQMQSLKDKGISVIGMQDYLAWRRGEKNIPPRSAIITIDDGYKSIYDTAWPILKKFGYPATLFVYTDYIKGGPKSGGESLSWDQLAQLRDEGADIQSHTVSHRDLRGKRGGAQAPNYEAWLWEELNGSKRMLEERLAIKVNALAVPYGFCNQHVRDIAAKAGYETILTVYGQKLGFSTPLDSIGRYIIEANKPKLFATATDFGTNPANIAGGGLPEPIAELTTSSIVAQPADGESTKDSKPLIKANLQSLPPLDPGSLQMRVSGLGVVPASYSPSTKSVSYRPTKELQKGDYTVIVSAKSQGKKTEARWSFKVE